LERIEKDKAWSYPHVFFYPDFLNDRTVFADKSVALFTGEDWKSAFEEGLKNVPEGSQLQAVFSLNTKYWAFTTTMTLPLSRRTFRLSFYPK
jgi:hypothetical protein